MGDIGLCDSPSRASNIHTTSAGPAFTADALAVEGEGGAQGDALGGDGDEASSTQCENEPLPLDLQCWPDLVELTRCINVKRNAALYAGVLQVRARMGTRQASSKEGLAVAGNMCCCQCQAQAFICLQTS